MRQFAFIPRIENQKGNKRHVWCILAGMGGSRLAATLMQAIYPDTRIEVHNTYGLPRVTRGETPLIIASSYSGNTEETLDAFHRARRARLPLLAITTGGKLLRAAKASRTPYIKLPQTGIQPRHALGFSFQAVAAAMGRSDILRDARARAVRIIPARVEQEGMTLSKKLFGAVPLLYVSRDNGALALNWKVRFNETAKIPAFWNELPELNHNEMTGFDTRTSTRVLSKRFQFLFFRDAEDHPHIKRRMRVLRTMFQARGLGVHSIPLKGVSRFEKIITSVVVADWVSYYLALRYRVPPEEVPMVEEFKKRIA